MTTGKPGLSTNRKSILEGFMEKAIVFLHEPTTKEKIQHYLIDPLLNHVTKVHAICVSCGNLAQFSHRTASEGGQVLVGAVEKYRPLCRTCYQSSSH